MNYIQTGDVYKWWENRYGRPYPTKGLVRSDFRDDYLRNWLELLEEKTLCDLQATCSTHLRDRTTPLTQDNLSQVHKEILEKVIAVFRQTVQQALLEDPIANSYYKSWDSLEQKDFAKTSLDISQRDEISACITKLLQSELDRSDCSHA